MGDVCDWCDSGGSKDVVSLCLGAASFDVVAFFFFFQAEDGIRDVRT